MATPPPAQDERLFPNIDINCPRASGHATGLFCRHCRGILMPWNDDLPLVRDDSGYELQVGPPGGMVAGVQLRNLFSIFVLSMVAFLEINGRSKFTITGLPELAQQHPESETAGHGIVELVQSIQALAGANDEVPEWYDIINLALSDPDMTADTYRNNIVSRFEGPPQHSGGDQASPTPRRGLGGAASRQERRERERREVEDQANDPDNDTDFISEPYQTGSKANKPPPTGNWEFVTGTNHDMAVLGRPDPSKFIYIRQDKDDLSRIDLRKYAKIPFFDWNDPKCIEGLNKARRQIRYRTTGPHAESRPPWTILEKDVLKDLIKEELDRVKARKLMNWEQIVKGLNSHFEDIIQDKGSPLATTNRPTKGEKDSDIEKGLLAARKGIPSRTAKAMKAQATKYDDIIAILNSKKNGRGKKRNLGEQSSEEEVDQDDIEDEGEPPKKRLKPRKQGPRSPPGGPKKPPGPPPPAGGAGGIAGPTGLEGLGVRARRPIVPGR